MKTSSKLVYRLDYIRFERSWLFDLNYHDLFRSNVELHFLNYRVVFVIRLGNLELGSCMYLDAFSFSSSVYRNLTLYQGFKMAQDVGNFVINTLQNLYAST